MDPTASEPLRDAGVMQHDLAVTRSGDELTLVFGGGTSTVQTFRRLGDGADLRLYRFGDGALAFTGDFFILVIGNAQRAVTGYGTYARDGSSLALQAVRWSASDGRGVINLRDTEVPAIFDEHVLMLPGGQSFAVVH